MRSADDLQVFFVVAQERRLSRAAEKLGIQHSTVSRRITRLEEDLGYVLFDRGSDGWNLTTEGKLLLAPAEAVHSAMADASVLFGDPDGDSGATVRVICPDAMGMYLLAPALSRLDSGNDGPNIELFTTTRNIESRIREFDVAISMERPSVARVSSWHLSPYRIGIFSSRRYLSAKDTISSLEDLQDHPHVGFIDRSIDVLPLQSLQKNLLKPPEVQCEHVALQIRAVASGAGIATFPVFVAQREPELVQVLPEFEYRRDYWITLSNTARRLGPIQRVVRFITDVMAEHEAVLRGTDSRAGRSV